MVKKPKIHKGPRGGKYRVVKGKKRYLSKKIKTKAKSKKAVVAKKTLTSTGKLLVHDHKLKKCRLIKVNQNGEKVCVQPIYKTKESKFVSRKRKPSLKKTHYELIADINPPKGSGIGYIDEFTYFKSPELDQLLLSGVNIGNIEGSQKIHKVIWQAATAVNPNLKNVDLYDRAIIFAPSKLYETLKERFPRYMDLGYGDLQIGGGDSTTVSDLKY